MLSEIMPTMNSSLKALFLALVQLQAAEALDNGIGRKPHMGWSSWVRILYLESNLRQEQMWQCSHNTSECCPV